MRIAEVIGRVTLSKCHPSLRGSTWRLVAALDEAGLKGQTSGRGEPFVVFDEFGASEGHQVGVSEGAEASAPFYPESKPIDGYVAAIFDRVDCR